MKVSEANYFAVSICGDCKHVILSNKHSPKCKLTGKSTGFVANCVDFIKKQRKMRVRAEIETKRMTEFTFNCPKCKKDIDDCLCGSWRFEDDGYTLFDLEEEEK